MGARWLRDGGAGVTGKGAPREASRGSLRLSASRTPRNLDHFSICACHPCAGAMLIFSVLCTLYTSIYFWCAKAQPGNGFVAPCRRPGVDGGGAGGGGAVAAACCGGGRGGGGGSGAHGWLTAHSACQAFSSAAQTQAAAAEGGAAGTAAPLEPLTWLEAEGAEAAAAAAAASAGAAGLGAGRAGEGAARGGGGGGGGGAGGDAYGAAAEEAVEAEGAGLVGAPCVCNRLTLVRARVYSQNAMHAPRATDSPHLHF